MKRKDTLVIVVIAIFAGIISLTISKIFFTSSKERNLTAETVQPITAEFQKPDEAVFNDKAINPTKLIQIGDSTNQQPF
jgi:hypothetical protein